MTPAKTDVAVLILFFNRPTVLKKLFDIVREARPSKLFLFQDGPRGERDTEGIMACREIVADIDWECEVHRNYQEKNLGCDPANFNAHKWAFSIVDKCIVFEDDDLPSLSFFPFCKEMLDRYEHDQRICMISGFNTQEITPDIKEDYFFTSVFSIWGWASWKRVVDQWDESYSFLDDKQSMRQLRELSRQRGYQNDFEKAFNDHRSTGKAYYETIFRATMLFNSSLAIMPTRNMINMNLCSDSTHISMSLNVMPKALRRLYTMARYELDFPIRHPKYVIENVAYKDAVFRIQAWNHPLIKVLRSFEELFLNLRYGNFSNIKKAILHRYAVLTNKVTHV